MQQYAGIKEAAGILGINEKTVQNQCKRGNIPCLKIGSRYRIPFSWLERQAKIEAPTQMTAADLASAARPPQEQPPTDPGAPAPAAAPVATSQPENKQGEDTHAKRKPEYDIESKIRRPVNKPKTAASGRPGPANNDSSRGTGTGFLAF